MTTKNEIKPAAPAEALDGGCCAVADGSAFRVKLLQLWIIPVNGSENWGGVWETIGVRELNTEKESWDVRRVMACDENQPLRESRKVPNWLLLEYGRCVKLQTLFWPNPSPPPSGNP